MVERRLQTLVPSGSIELGGFYMNKVIHGDCLEKMRELEGNSIDLTVTSPPYDNLRDYKGYTFNFEEIAKELYRVTKQGGGEEE